MKRKKKADKTKQYSLWDNCRYALRQLRQKEGDIGMAVCGGDVALGVLLPFLEAALAGAVAAILTSGRRPEAILAGGGLCDSAADSPVPAVASAEPAV